MNKILISAVAVATLFGYEGCGVNKKEALNALSQTIYVNVNNKFTKNEELHKGFLDFFSKSVTSTSSQSSNVTLKNIKYITKNNQVCAEVSKKDVEKKADEDLKSLVNYDIHNLPQNFQEKKAVIQQLLAKINFVKAIANPSKYEINRLDKLEKNLKDLANKGAVVFNLNIPYAKITISSKIRTFTPSDVILLPAGKYSYKISAKGYQDKIGDFEISPTKETKIDVSLDSLEDLKSAEKKSKYFTKATEIDVNYGYAVAPNDKKEWDAQKRIEVRSFKNYGIYKLGFGVLAGTNTHWTAKDMDELEFVLAARIQFPELFDTQFHIGSVPFLPYVGVEGGWDIYKFIDNGNNLDDITTVVRGTIGTTILIHKQFGFNIQYAHDFAEKEDNIISGGIVMDF